MRVNGTLINYYFHCKRQCYLHGNRLNLEDNSEIVKIGKAIHEDKAAKSNNSEIEIDNIKLDKLTAEYLTEIKKSDADLEAGKCQLLYYLKILKSKGIVRKGKLECIEKNKSDKKVTYVDLDEESEKELDKYVEEIEKLILKNEIPDVLNKPTCKKCAYYEFCYI
ncbi:CRISPR-associated protein Cas4 [Clostridium neonatale]|uniref:CRISPR-associated endonuclease Cas4 n=1 Tax=Clostridium neonatale TaxID=137838 RepID=A0A650MG62_9CLOT|nr:CRISPR-associated protein Cas4 [Clostridium neonatale]MBP8315858.1 CRISPR-associated protein Cas4 [Clostridium neonatale]CAG9705941.1 Putative CRISPR-associated endonuclease Cas4 [Clostridium neonatale]CAI3535971.1 putative CRISPR-associated endonuclease Cas4 [Clostridium neonatale]CAI3557409.1 putative CRISPR-associated endonuclease Cas4 [Clostridium neonatale]CAI3557827.1 putative CRISPR-associated endonuclease Cas4 [Clostridium neonatale]